MSPTSYIDKGTEQTSTSGSRKQQPDRARVERNSGTAHAWAQGLDAWRGDSLSGQEAPDEHRERIACLEAIIAVLLEKNERIRQQLMASMK
jgi:hypothetical protein